MISSQRKSHKYIWLVITIVMPILLVMALNDLSFSSESNSVKMEKLTVSLKDSIVQIELTQPFQSPSPVVYELDDKGRSGKILGQLKGIGKYKFSASKAVNGIVVMDAIKKEELFKIEF